MMQTMYCYEDDEFLDHLPHILQMFQYTKNLVNSKKGKTPKNLG